MATFLAQIRSFAAATDGPAIRSLTHPAPHAGHIRVLLLDQPHNKNALSRKLCNELRRHVDEVKAEGQNGGTRALVIASNIDKVFCAGADLKERKTMSQAEYVVI
jgi:methylglutaconyl-CoA hydratase